MLRKQLLRALDALFQFSVTTRLPVSVCYRHSAGTRELSYREQCRRCDFGGKATFFFAPPD
jgi:hypothetical protein